MQCYLAIGVSHYQHILTCNCQTCIPFQTDELKNINFVDMGWGKFRCGVFKHIRIEYAWSWWPCWCDCFFIFLSTMCLYFCHSLTAEATLPKQMNVASTTCGSYSGFSFLWYFDIWIALQLQKYRLILLCNCHCIAILYFQFSKVFVFSACRSLQTQTTALKEHQKVCCKNLHTCLTWHHPSDFISHCLAMWSPIMV